MTDDLIGAYLRDVGALLDGSDPERGRVLSEIDGHLRDSAAEHVDRGASITDAAAQAIAEFGPPQVVAAGFASDLAAVPKISGVRRWLPVVLPSVWLILGGALLVWSLTWLPSGRTLGQQHAQLIYLRSTAIALALVIGAVWSIRNADHDPKWRLAAWSCSVLAVILFVF